MRSRSSTIPPRAIGGVDLKSLEETPFHADGYVYFHLSCNRFVVATPEGEPAYYSVPDFTPGVHRLKVDAIVPETRNASSPTFEVDAAQIFFIDAAYYPKFEAAFDPQQGHWPNYDYFDRLRRALGTDFGYLVAGAEPAEHFDGDGTYCLDLRGLEGPGRFTATAPAAGFELYVKVAKSMKTYVCTSCFEDELMVDFGDAAHYRRKASEAIGAGWLVTQRA
jgi:hypothetical protein